MDRWDVAVIGGGLLGCAAAYHLARGGASVVLLERGQLNREASGQNAGSLHFQLEYRMVEHGDALADQFALSIPLALEADRRWSELEAELGEQLEIVQHGGLMVAETPEQIALLERKHALERRSGLNVELISGDEARALAPYLSEHVLAAGWCPTEGHANPRLIGPAFARAAVRAGAVVRTEARVAALARAGTEWRLRLASGEELIAGSVLIAAGIWSGELAAMADVRLPVIPVALSMLATAASPPVMGHLVQHVGRRLSMKQTEDGNVLIGGGWPSKLVQRDGVVDLDARPELRYESLAGNAWTAAEVVPAVRSLQVIRAWAGVAAVTSDQIPLLGEVRRRAGLYVAAGGAGFTNGPTFARLMSELILTGQASLPLDTYSPHRFAHLTFV
jgi:sarcosine oxidase subunit beta